MGTLNEDLTAIKCVEDTLNNNKVARFSYTEEAYRCNCADGVTVYDVDNEQNIPIGNAEIMKVNETVLSKGWRSQASSITRMLMNHFIGRLSYNVNKLTDNVSGLLDTFIGHLGTADGIATLDANGRIPYSQLPESAIEYKGNWNANTNTPTLSDGMAGATKGDFYIVSVGGTQDLGHGDIEFFANDRVIYDGSVWGRLSAGDVKTVNNVAPVAGNITLTKADIGLENVDNTADSEKTVACAGNSTKFAGYTFAQAYQAFRGGTLTMSDAGVGTTVPVVVCTGATTVGKSGGLSYGNAECALYGVAKVVNRGVDNATYFDVGLYGGNSAGRNQDGAVARATLCGKNGMLYVPAGLVSDVVYTERLQNLGSGANYRDINLIYGAVGQEHGATFCGIDGALGVAGVCTQYIDSLRNLELRYGTINSLDPYGCSHHIVAREYGSIGVVDFQRKRQGTVCGTDVVHAYAYMEGGGCFGYMIPRLSVNLDYSYISPYYQKDGNTYGTPFRANQSESAVVNQHNRLYFFAIRNCGGCYWGRNDLNDFILTPQNGWHSYCVCSCDDVTRCICQDIASAPELYIGDKEYFDNKCCFAVYHSCTPAGHSWMSTTLYNNTYANLILDLSGGHCGCYNGVSVRLLRGCCYTFCSCYDATACAKVRLAPECSGGFSSVIFQTIKLVAQPETVPSVID